MFSHDLVITNINKILFETAEKLAKNLFEINLYEINKQLNRNPEEYNDSNHQSHVQAALRFNMDSTNNKKYRSGDVVSYIICEVVNLHFKQIFTIWIFMSYHRDSSDFFLPNLKKKFSSKTVSN
jgi:DNA polymerase elongation subunit (family B)